VRRILLFVVVAAVLGMGAFALMVVDAVSVESAVPSEARSRPPT